MQNCQNEHNNYAKLSRNEQLCKIVSMNTTILQNCREMNNYAKLSTILHNCRPGRTILHNCHEMNNYAKLSTIMHNCSFRKFDLTYTL